MIRGKHSIVLKKNILPREKQMKLLEDKFSLSSIVYMWGEAGCGKTTAGKLYLQGKKGVKKVFFQLDEEDNQIDIFISNLLQTVMSLGLRLDNTTGYKSVKSLFHDILLVLENSKKNFYIMVDQIHLLKNPVIVREMLFFMEYLPSNCYLILSSHQLFPEEWRELWNKGRISLITAADLLYSKREIRAYFQLINKKVTDEEVNEINAVTGGWPGAVAMIAMIKSEEETITDRIRIPVISFVEKFLWNGLDKKEQEILICANELLFIETSLCEQLIDVPVSRENLNHLYYKGLLVPGQKNGQYRINTMVQYYLNEWIDFGGTGICSEQWYKKAADWYEKHGYIREMFSMLQSSVHLKEKLIEYANVIPKQVPMWSLDRYLRNITAKNQEAEIIFLKGFLAARQMDVKILDECEQEIFSLWKHKKENIKYMELYLNLLYFDSRVDVCNFIKIVEKYWHYDDKFQLYSYSGSCPIFSSGMKNFAPMFAGTIKEERAYIKIWNEKMDTDATLALQLAKFGYYMQTERQDKVYEEVQEVYDSILESGNGELQAGLFALLIDFKEKKYAYDFSDEIETLEITLKSSNELYVWENCHILNTLSGGKKKEEEMILWLLYDSPKEKDKNILESPFLFLLKARAYFKLKQYRKTISLCEKMQNFYEKRDLTQFQAECLFKAAAANYEDGGRKEAAVAAAKALTLGTKYRYLDIYTHYGETGYLLVENFQKLTGVQPSTKKQYYYGNVLRADYAGYQRILLRCVKKARKESVIINQDDEIELGRLTMTETAILNYISHGKGNQEIADLMNIKITTVKSHIYNIYRKLGVSTRVQAVNEAKKKGIVE